MQLYPSLPPILENIDFLNRYKQLRAHFPNTDDGFEDYDNDEVLKIIQEIGYSAKYDRKEKFFGIKESIEEYVFTFNISCKFGLTELIWGLTKNNERLTLGGPWKLIGDLLLGDDCAIKKPAFRNYEELKAILQEAFVIYEDFKREVLQTLP